MFTKARSCVSFRFTTNVLFRQSIICYRHVCFHALLSLVLEPHRGRDHMNEAVIQRRVCSPSRSVGCFLRNWNCMFGVIIVRKAKRTLPRTGFVEMWRHGDMTSLNGTITVVIVLPAYTEVTFGWWFLAFRGYFSLFFFK